MRKGQAQDVSPAQQARIAVGWSAADVEPHELVDDEWIAANTEPGKEPSKPRTAVRSLLGALGLQRGAFSRDQMRRIAARTGYPYVEAWSSHNYGSMINVLGALCHHTGTTWDVPGDYPSLKVVRDGRPGLENSLCAFGLGRSGTIYLVSEKVSWHAGVGEYNGITDGNSYMAGIEAESDGAHWTPQEVDAYPRLVASILVEIGRRDEYTTRHATFALPAGRKTDFAGWPGGTEPFWSTVYRYLDHPETINRNYNASPAPTPTPTEDDDMKLNAYRVKGTAEVRAGGPGIWWHVPSTAILQGMQANGTLGPVVDVSQADFDAARLAWLSAVVTTPLHSTADPRGDFPLVDRLSYVDAAVQRLEAAQAQQQPPTPGA